ncbi:MAG: sensor histidine kinase, partial [Pseudomonadota bacterium]
IILLPLLCVAVLVGLWQLNNAQRTATDVFDRSLLSAALAVVNDVAISDGDALSARTRDILADPSGGQVFYHVYAPDGVIVAGYATPPVGIPSVTDNATEPTYFDATYLGRDVSGVRLQRVTEVEGFSGIFTTTVWQDRAVREAFVRDLILRSAVTILALIASLALIVWFGVRVGLRPLTDLESAIAARSSDELTAIQRSVPTEVAGIVRVLNRLFAQVSRSMTAQAEFISNAAHQLRNPIAGVLSMAEAVDRAPTPEEAQRRSKDLLIAARETADLSQKLLLLERAKTISPSAAQEQFDLGVALPDWVTAFAAGVPDHVAVRFEGDDVGQLKCDPIMLREALRNLLDNALRHGGPQLASILVSATRTADEITLTVADDGIGIAPDALPAVRERFRQVAPTSVSGLGVSIVDAVVQGHGGRLDLIPQPVGLVAEIHLPLNP